MKCRHYRPEPALSPLFLAEGTAPLRPGATAFLLTDELTGLIWARALSALERVEAGPSYPREAISRRSSSGSSRAYAAGGGARAPQGTHTLRSVTVTVVSLVCGDQHSPNPLLIPERRACQVAPAGSSALPPCCEGGPRRKLFGTRLASAANE